ncbi:MAG: hypothetical protein AAF363_00760 [Bacteroidota bacterium]
MVEFFNENPDWWLYALIPVISAVVGWGTNVLALKMTFYPLEFIGIPPYLGWQGIIPSKAAKMASKSVDILTKKLITVEERFEQIDPNVAAEQMQPEVERLSKRIVNEVMEAQAPLVWIGLPGPVKTSIYQKSKENLPMILREMMAEIKEKISSLFDLKGMVIRTLVKNRRLLNEIFIRCGEQEFRFIERSGFYFGFLFGLIQMVTWYFYKPWWFLPVAGLFVGFATNWVALKLIFKPLHPINLGIFKIQGLFIKRQKEVAQAYSELVATNIINSRNIFETIMHGKASPELIQIIRKYVSKSIDLTVGGSKDLIKLLSGRNTYDNAKNIASSGVIEDMRITAKQIYGYTEEALNLEETMKVRMSNLPPEDFQGFLRPVFQEDETKLILVGAFLGFLAGLAQLFILFN